jgi:hypothetical protein
MIAPLLRGAREMLRLKIPVRRRVGLMMIAGTLAVAGLAPSAANADAISLPWLNCTALSGYKIELPANGSARQSYFAISQDYGSWQYTNWVYTDGWQYWEYVNGWQYVNWGGAWIPYSFADESTHHIIVWEKRTGYNWRYVGECDASSYLYGGGVIGVGH